ncbi:MAG: carotenoid oxygenase family protein [Acidobacteriota bacterium]
MTRAADHAPGLDAAFARTPEERSGPVLGIEGEIPRFLRGTYYLNGPARFERHGLRYGHWLDGDGMVCALRFGEDGVSLTSRFVRGNKWRAEEEAGSALFRAFGTAFPGDRLGRGGVTLESPLNVSIYPYGGTLLALGEQGLPWELDPETLETRGEYTFGGRLGPVAPFAAHPKIDPETGELFNFGISFAAGAPQLQLYRFGSDGALVYRRRLPLPGPCSVHDFALSRRHAVFHLSPYHLDMEALRQGASVLESLRWEPGPGTRLLVVSRETGEEVASVPVKERYSLHTVNAFECGDRLVVDVLELDRPVYDQYRLSGLFEDVGEGRPVRMVVDLGADGMGRVVDRREIAYRFAPDFAAIDPARAGRPYEELWMLGISATGKPGRKFFDQLVHARWNGPLDIWRAPAGQYLAGEPAFAGDPADPGAGAVICPLFDAHREETAFAVFDASRVAAGPVAVLRTGSLLHLAFHGVFEPAPRKG